MQYEAYQKAVALLKQVSSPIGFTAAVQEEDNYRRVWTRDSSLCGLAALATGDAALAGTFKTSIETVFQHQHPSGFIPSNVAEDGTVSYGGVVGRVDNHAWAVISACNYAQVTNDAVWLKQYTSAIEKCLALMTAWEFNGRGLMYVPQSADWADEYFHHGYILYNQLLRLWALRCAGKMLRNEALVNEAARVEEAIALFFENPERYAKQTGRELAQPAPPYWLMGFNPATVYTQFDLQANALALLLQVGTEEKAQHLVCFLDEWLCNHSRLLPSFHPAVQETAHHMQELKNNYAYRFRNATHQFHNGGLWPVWNGLMAFAASDYNTGIQQQLLQRTAEACALQGWEFNECFHGLTGQPDGVPHCAWSAAGLILASEPAFKKLLIT